MSDQVQPKTLYSLVKNKYTHKQIIKAHKSPPQKDFDIFKCLCL